MNSAFTSCCAGAFAGGAAQTARGATRLRTTTTSRAQTQSRVPESRTAAGREFARGRAHQTGASPENAGLDPAGVIWRGPKPYHRICQTFSLLLCTYSLGFTRIYGYRRLPASSVGLGEVRLSELAGSTSRCVALRRAASRPRDAEGSSTTRLLDVADKIAREREYDVTACSAGRLCAGAAARSGEAAVVARTASGSARSRACGSPAGRGPRRFRIRIPPAFESRLP
jgi:hypothetical protein